MYNTYPMFLAKIISTNHITNEKFTKYFARF